MTEETIVETPELAEHFDHLIASVIRGRLVFFLGAAANACDRDEHATWNELSEFLPTGEELSEYLSRCFGVDRGDLARVAQHASLKQSPGLLYLKLREMLIGDYVPTRLHKLLAELPSILRDRSYPQTTDRNYRRLLLISTNYDDLMERALDGVGQAYHTLVYEADGPKKGKFVHRSPDGTITWVSRPNKYEKLLGDEHPVVMKFHGSLDRGDSSHDSFVITEDHYIEYLTHTKAEYLIPAPLPVMLKSCGLLFLGHGLRDWNLRVLLHRIWGRRRLRWQSWAIQRSVDPLEAKLWERHDIDIIDTPLAHYVPMLRRRLCALPSASPYPRLP